MSSYIRRVRGFSFDIKLFLLYNLLANIGFGVIELVFNFPTLADVYKYAAYDGLQALARYEAGGPTPK